MHILLTPKLIFDLGASSVRFQPRENLLKRLALRLSDLIVIIVAIYRKPMRAVREDMNLMLELLLLQRFPPSLTNFIWKQTIVFNRYHRQWNGDRS